MEKKVKLEMKKHKDYKAYYYRAISGNTLRLYKEESDTNFERLSTHPMAGFFPDEFKDDNDWPETLPEND